MILTKLSNLGPVAVTLGGGGGAGSTGEVDGNRTLVVDSLYLCKHMILLRIFNLELKSNIQCRETR